MYNEIMAVYEGREGAKLVFQPRIKHWYDVNLSSGMLPDRYRGMYLDEIYEDLGVAPREVWGYGESAPSSLATMDWWSWRETM